MFGSSCFAAPAFDVLGVLGRLTAGKLQRTRKLQVSQQMFSYSSEAMCSVLNSVGYPRFECKQAKHASTSCFFAMAPDAAVDISPLRPFLSGQLDLDWM